MNLSLSYRGLNGTYNGLNKYCPANPPKIFYSYES